MWALAVLANGTVASGSDDGAIYVWNVDSNKMIHKFSAHNSRVSALIALPDCILVSGSYDKVIRIWDIFSLELLMELKGHISQVRDLAPLSGLRLA